VVKFKSRHFAAAPPVADAPCYKVAPPSLLVWRLDHFCARARVPGAGTFHGQSGDASPSAPGWW